MYKKITKKLISLSLMLSLLFTFSAIPLDNLEFSPKIIHFL